MRAEQTLDAAARGRARPVHPCCLSSYRLNLLYTCTGGKENFGVPSPLHPLPTPILGARSLLTSRPPNLWGKERERCVLPAQCPSQTPSHPVCC